MNIPFVDHFGTLHNAFLDLGLFVALPLTPLAQIPSSLKTSFQYGLGVMTLIGFLWGVVKIWGGADRMSKGDADGKTGIISGIIIAGAAAIMGALFAIFGMGDGILTPTFT